MSFASTDPFRSDPRFAAARIVCAARLAVIADDLVTMGWDRGAILSLAHRVYGTAGSYGFAEVAARALALEEAASGACPEDLKRACAELEAALRAVRPA